MRMHLPIFAKKYVISHMLLEALDFRLIVAPII